MLISKIEKYRVFDDDIFVIREDLCSPFPAPNNSKVIGLEQKLETLRKEGHHVIATQNTRISRLGWGISWLSKKFDLVHYDFYSDAGKRGVPFFQRMSQSFGGKIIPLRGNYSRIFGAMVKQWLKKHKINAYMLPLGLSMPEAVFSHSELVRVLPSDLLQGTFIVPASSGTISAGIIYGVALNNYRTNVISVFSSNFKISRHKKILNMILDTDIKNHLLSEKAIRKIFSKKHWDEVILNRRYGKVEKILTPFPCDVYLDRPAWKWMIENIGVLKKPVVFLNVGGEWNPFSGINNGLRGDGLTSKEEVNKYLEKLGGVKVDTN